MKERLSIEDQRVTLAWLDDSLRWARSGRRAGLTTLLDLVQAEILFDVAFSESPPSIRAAFGPEPGANGRA